MVVHGEQRPMCSNSSGGSNRLSSSSSSKKSKQKKTPQRGMGVAQLEELRIREQQKSSASAFSNSHHPLPFLASADPNILFRPPVDPNPLSRTSNSSDFFDPQNPPERGFLPMFWSAMESCPRDSDRKYGFLASMQSDSSSPGCRPPGLLQRRQFSMVNSSSPSTSGVNLQLEPPSNQSYSSNSHISSAWPDEERMVGMKRPWPFSPESMSFPCKVPIFAASFLKSDEPLGCGNGFIKFESKINAFREGTSSSSTNQSDRRMDDGFLTLGPSISKSKHPFPHSDLHEHDEYPRFGLQGSSQTTFYSFLPTEPTDGEAVLEDEALDGVDLNLKL